MREFTTAYEDIENEDAGTPPEEVPIPFMLDGREYKSYPPNEGQLAFMVAGLGRGHTDGDRFGTIVTLIANTLEPEDKDFLEKRMVSRDPKQCLNMKTMEGIFQYLTEEWFARPTQKPSGSAGSPPSDGQN